MKRAVVIGASRGIGLAFVRQLVGRGDRVWATLRDPDSAPELQDLTGSAGGRLRLLPLEITNDDSLEAAFTAIQAETPALDLLISNAGIYPRNERIGTLNREVMINALHTNAIGPALLIQRFVELLRAGNTPKVVTISSRLGSLAITQSGANYSYKSSKAALNMLLRGIAFELAPAGITAITMHPGWVQTDMGGPSAPLTPEESVRGMLAVIEELRPEDRGRFIQWDGEELPW